MGSDTWTIGQLASTVGLPVSTLRYYEREGLLRAQARSQGNYRLYGPEGRERLRFVLAARDSGLALSDIREMLGGRNGQAPPCERVRELIRARLAAVEEQRQKLQHAHEVLQEFLQACEERGGDNSCPVIEELAPGARGPRGGTA